MLIRKLKIATRLIISSIAFLLPIIVMLYFIISSYNYSIRFSKYEIYGDAYLRPLDRLLEYIPAHMRITLGYDGAEKKGEIENKIDAAVKDLLAVDEKYGAMLKFTDVELSERGRLEAKARNIADRWNKDLKGAVGGPSAKGAYASFIKTLRTAITQAGDASNLILDPDLDSYYMMDVTLLALPQTQDRLGEILNFIDDAYDRSWAVRVRGKKTGETQFTEEDKRRFVSYEAMLSEADYARVIASTTTSLNEDKNFYGTSQTLGEKIPPLLKSYEESNKEFLSLLKRISDEEITTVDRGMLIDAGKRALETGFRLWESGIDELDILVGKRVEWYERRKTLALILTAITLVIASSIVILIGRSIRNSIQVMKAGLGVVTDKDLTRTIEVKSKDELGELMLAFNNFLVEIRGTIDSFKNSAELVSSSVYDLSASAKETTTTANQQSASVSEIVSTMEGNTNLSEQIAVKTEEVAKLSIKTQEVSEKGARLRSDNEQMMGEIREQNDKIIVEIKKLAGMIGRINEVIDIIDGIADQTKLIAFNASLEASSAGEAGARFSVVASEIRRFADNVVNSTREIKGKIDEIQEASDNLIKEANNGSKKIDSGYTAMAEQETVFMEIVDNSQNVATKSQQISNLTKQQELASSQIFTTLKEISLGIRNFVVSTATTSKTADDLSGMATRLRTVVESFKTSSEGENR